MAKRVEAKNAATDIMALAPVAAQAQIERLKLFTGTELADIPHTPENVAKAVHFVKAATAATRALLQASIVQRGMYLCWLKANYTQHGEWERFCGEQFPDVPKRSRQRWMAAYLDATGQKRWRELPAYSEDDLEDAEVAGAIEDLNAEPAARMPRRQLAELYEKVCGNLEKGRKQREQDRERIEALEAQVRDAQEGASCVPPHVRDAAQACEHLRSAFWRLVRDWIGALPEDEESLAVHLALHEEIKQHALTLWETHLGPAVAGRKEER